MTNAGEKNNSAARNGRLARQAFWAMVQRDLLIQARDAWEFVFRVAMLPFILILTYGFVLPTLGVLPKSFPSQMFAGMVGMSMLITGIHGTAVPFTMDFNNMHEIEDRLQAPVSSTVVGLAKMLVGIIESFVGGLIVLPISLIFMGSRIDVTMGAGGILPLALVLVLISLASAALGLLVGTIVKPNQIAAMFPGFLMPVVFLGAIFFSWQSLSAIPVLQAIVLVNPLVYANEALRAILTPRIAHMPLVWSVLGLVAAIVIMGGLGFRRFHRMVVGQKA
ncbi:MAG: ABC transporter permease [Olsenella sp.]|jgi:ABC-2 type transport system permease protein|nr:ABC transporter permease [Olsenella sp.]MCI1289949.1 ABC transporter permease [Olsenella sp.]